MAVEVVKSFKYLGLIIDHRFTWASHIDGICRSLRACLVQFYKLQYCVGVKILKDIYYALVHSILRYGLQCYGHSTATQLKRIESLNKKIIKIIVKKYVFAGDVKEDIYRTLRILPINKLFKYVIILENYYKSEYIVPAKNKYSLREVKLRVPFYFNKYGERQDEVAIPRILNSVPAVLRSIDTIGVVKTSIIDWLLGGKV